MGIFAVSGLSIALGQISQELKGTLVKPAHADYQSKAFDDVEKGNKLFIAGDFMKAAEAYDDAAEKDQDSPIPWWNGGLTAKERGKLGAAKLSANTAFRLGDKSPRGKVIAADIDIARKQFEPAKSKLEQALFGDPYDAYGLLEYAKWNLSQSHLREAERFFWQGYREGAPIVLDSKLIGQSQLTFDGGTREAGVHYSQQTVTKSGALAYSLGMMTQTAGTDAAQRLGKLDLTFDSPIGLFSTNLRSLQSDRPGISSPSLLLPTTPGSKLDFKHAMLGIQRRSDKWTFHANYRSEVSDLRGAAASPFALDNHTSQWILESRFDSGPWMAGGGYSVVHRNSTGSPAIEPLEAIFPNGTTNMYNSYVVNRQEVGRNVRVTSGAIFTSAQGLEQVGIMGQVAIRLIGNRYLKFGVKPGINRVQTNLGPINEMAGTLGANSVDRLTGSAYEFNRDVALPSLNSRITNAFISYPLSNTLNLTGFRTTFTNQAFVGSDPVTSSSLNTTNVPYGKVIGATAENTTALSPSTSMRLAATIQTPSGSLAGPTYDFSSGNPVLTKTNSLPNIPRFEANALFDWSSSASTLAVAVHYVGDRTQMVNLTNNAGLPPGTYLVPVKAGLNFEAHYSLALSEGKSLEVGLYNLFNNNFYPGFRTSPQLVIGYTSRM